MRGTIVPRRKYVVLYCHSGRNLSHSAWKPTAPAAVRGLSVGEWKRTPAEAYRRGAWHLTGLVIRPAVRCTVLPFGPSVACLDVCGHLIPRRMCLTYLVVRGLLRYHGGYLARCVVPL